MSEIYCSAIDNGLFVGTAGQVKVCCAGSYPFGSISEQSIDTILSSDEFNKVKQNLHNNTTDKFCSGCDKIDKTAPGSSQRFAFNQAFKSDGSRRLKMIDLRWSNICNLSCRYCNPGDSSEWQRLLGTPIESVDRDYTDSLFTLLEQNKDTIELVYLLGGEPLLQKHNERLLSIVNKNTKIELLTNLSVRLDKNRIYKALVEHGNVLWNLSFDTVGDRFEYVRQGADWQVFTDNVKRIVDDFGPGSVLFHPVYSIWNALNLKEYYDYTGSINVHGAVNWQIAGANNITRYRTDSFLTFGHKRKIIDLAIKEIESLNITNTTLLGIKDSLINDIEIPGQDLKFLNWTARMEQFMPPRKSFTELWPELNTLLTQQDTLP